MEQLGVEFSSKIKKQGSPLIQLLSALSELEEQFNINQLMNLFLIHLSLLLLRPILSNWHVKVQLPLREVTIHRVIPKPILHLQS